MAQNMYLKLDGIDGESSSKQADKQIEVISWSHGVSMPISMGQGTIQSLKHGRCDHQDLTITKYMDNTTPTLNVKCSAGDNIKTAVLTIHQADAGGAYVEFYKIELTDILLTSVHTSASGSDHPVETVTMHYNTIKWTYATHTKDSPGGKKGNVSTGWDLEKNTKL